MIHSLTFRITLGTTLGFLLSTALAFVFLDQALRNALENRTDRELESLILELSTGLSLDQNSSQLQAELDILSLTYGTKNRVFRLFTPHLDIIAQNESPQWKDLPEHPLPQFDDDHPLFHWAIQHTELHPEGVRWLALKTDMGPVIQIGSSLSENEELRRRGRIVFAIAIFLILLIGITGSVVMTRQGLKGLKSIGNVAHGVREHLNFGQEVSLPTGCRETDQLAQTFNLMLRQIQILIQSQKDMMDSIAHDIRSPVARMRVFAESQLMAGKGAELPGRIVEGCDQILDLVNTLLEISATESGTAPLDMHPLNLADLASETYELIAPLAEEKGCQLEPQLESTWVTGDTRMLQRVISNLLDNAIKFTPENGRIQIKTTLDGGYAVLNVSNSGAGISFDKIDSIFDRFVQLDPARSQGSGLGLSFCKAAVEAMGGTISCQSTPNELTSFLIQFPALEEAEYVNHSASEKNIC